MAEIINKGDHHFNSNESSLRSIKFFISSTYYIFLSRFFLFSRRIFVKHRKFLLHASAISVLHTFNMYRKFLKLSLIYREMFLSFCLLGFLLWRLSAYCRWMYTFLCVHVRLRYVYIYKNFMNVIFSTKKIAKCWMQRKKRKSERMWWICKGRNYS